MQQESPSWKSAILYTYFILSSELRN